MSVAKRSLRIFALPLSKQSVTASTIGSGKGNTVLNTYYHFVTAPPSGVDQGDLSLLSRLTGKVTGIWTGWGKAASGSWRVGYSHPLLRTSQGLTLPCIQVRVFNYGERLIDRLDFEELALKSLDPSLGPRITSPRTVGTGVQQPYVYPFTLDRIVLKLISHFSDPINIPTAYNHIPLVESPDTSRQKSAKA